MVTLTFGSAGDGKAVEETQKIWSAFANEVDGNPNIKLRGLKILDRNLFRIVKSPDELEPCEGVIDRDVGPILSLQLIDPDLLEWNDGIFDWRPNIHPSEYSINSTSYFIAACGGCGAMEMFMRQPWARIGNGLAHSNDIKSQRKDLNINGLTIPALKEFLRGGESKREWWTALDNLHVLVKTEFSPPALDDGKDKEFLEQRVKDMSRGLPWSLREWPRAIVH